MLRNDQNARSLWKDVVLRITQLTFSCQIPPVGFRFNFYTVSRYTEEILNQLFVGGRVGFDLSQSTKTPHHGKTDIPIINKSTRNPHQGPVQPLEDEYAAHNNNNNKFYRRKINWMGNRNVSGKTLNSVPFSLS